MVRTQNVKVNFKRDCEVDLSWNVSILLALLWLAWSDMGKYIKVEAHMSKVEGQSAERTTHKISYSWQHFLNNLKSIRSWICNWH